MDDGALFVGWGAPIAGRELMGLDVFNQTMQFNETLVKRGEITSYETFLLSHTGQRLRGFFMLRGDPLKLATLTMRDDFVKLASKAALVIEDLTIAPAFAGEAMTKMLEAHRTAAKSMTVQPV